MLEKVGGVCFGCEVEPGKWVRIKFCIDSFPVLASWPCGFCVRPMGGLLLDRMALANLLV